MEKMELFERLQQVERQIAHDMELIARQRKTLADLGAQEVLATDYVAKTTPQILGALEQSQFALMTARSDGRVGSSPASRSWRSTSP